MKKVANILWIIFGGFILFLFWVIAGIVLFLTIVGIPFGMHRMMAIVLPRGYDLGGTIGFFVLGLLISGIVGGVWVVFNVISGILQTGRRIYKRF